MKRKKLLALLMVPTMILSMFPAPLAVHADSADWGARAAYGGEGGTELFLGGKFIELGISNWGISVRWAVSPLISVERIPDLIWE